jgi:N-acetylmuramoyl-L-alanine amidase
VGSDNVPRLCLDFREARWADRLTLPAPMGDLKAIRVGYPPDTGAARLTVEVPSAAYNVTSLFVDKDEVVATLARGAQTKVTRLSPEAEQELRLRQILIARNQSGVAGFRPEDRSQDGPLVDPVTGEPLDDRTIIRPNLRPEIELPGRFNPAGSLQGRTIVVDAGHGGKHAGAKGLYHLEKSLCLKMAVELQSALERRGANVIMTRTSDVFVSLDARCQIANQSGADIFISIHCNSMPRRNLQSGTETYWHSSQQSRRLARALHPRVVGTVRGRDGGIRNRSFQVIRETQMPSVLLEIAYINNTQDELLLADGDFHGRLADNIARGVLDYFGTDAE